MPIPIKKTSFFIIPPTGSWRLFGQEENKKIHIHEKYSPHPQIILPFIKRVYRYLSTTLCTIHPLPSPPRQENVVYKRFPLSSASPSFSSLLNREQDLVSPAWRAPQSVWLYIGPRQIPYYAHQRFSALLFVLLRKREFFFFWKILLFSSSLPLLPLLPPFHFLLLLIRFERSKRIILDSSFSADVAINIFERRKKEKEETKKIV